MSAPNKFKFCGVRGCASTSIICQEFHLNGAAGFISDSHLLGICPNIPGEAEVLQELSNNQTSQLSSPVTANKHSKKQIFPSAAQLQRAALITVCF